VITHPEGRTLEGRVEGFGAWASMVPVGTRVPKRSTGRTRRCDRSASCDPPPRPSRGHHSAHGRALHPRTRGRRA
jgi:hypothetical protein